MGKAEADRDYYADLELEPTADANEIKKAFKKLALRYHPDRNPGHEVEFNSKFQAIQSANEVLTDPQQRAKYDAQRIRSGLLHTYTGATPPPSKPNVPPRSGPAAGTSQFPPPPPPPPYTARTNVPPRPSGAQKYAQFSRADTSKSWRDTPRDEKDKFKAWEQMKHGTGPIPGKRTVPPKTARSSTFQPVFDQRNGATSKEGASRPDRWARFRETQTGATSNMGKPNANHTTQPSPKRAGFAPTTPTEDEKQARSAYFRVSRDDPPPTARKQHNMQPPPSPQPTAAKPDPLHAFKEKVSANEPFGNKPRVSTPYQTGGRGKEYFPAAAPGHGLHRAATSATGRESINQRGVSPNLGSIHVRAASAARNFEKRSPPRTKDSNIAGGYSSSDSSSSSSDEERPSFTSAANSRPTQVPKSRQPRPQAPQRQHTFNPNAKGPDAGDEPRASLGNTYYTGVRRHSAIDLDSKKSSGFSEHHAQHEAEKPSLPSDGSKKPTLQTSEPPPLARSKSWQEKWGSPPRDNDHHPHTGDFAGDQAKKTPMYAQPGYNPFSSPPFSGLPCTSPPSSRKWSDQWPFNSPKKPRIARAEPPPYWAVPSSLPPLKLTLRSKRPLPGLNTTAEFVTDSKADNDPFRSFNIPDYTNRAFARTSQPRSQSSERIDTRFSPEGSHPAFFSPPPNRTSTPLRNNVSQSEQTSPTYVQGATTDGDSFAKPVPPPPPPAEAKYSEAQWAAHLQDLRFDMDQPVPGRPSSRNGVRKRVRTWGTKAPNTNSSVDDPKDEPTAAANTAGESAESSTANSDVDPMDLDEPTPPKNAEAKANPDATASPSGQASGNDSTPRQGPGLPPRMNGYKPAVEQAADFNLGDWKNQYPFAPSNEGLGNMNDLSANLPFESRPSATAPNPEVPLSRHGLPNPPHCPNAPRNLTAASCEHYLSSLRIYMDKWNNFNAIMEQELAKRQASNKQASSCNWLSSKGTGYEEYMKGLEQHKVARMHLDTAYEMHEKNMKDLGLMRGEIARGRGDDGRRPSGVGDMLESLF